MCSALVEQRRIPLLNQIKIFGYKNKALLFFGRDVTYYCRDWLVNVLIPSNENEWLDIFQNVFHYRALAYYSSNLG